MPSEKFYFAAQVDGDGQPPNLTISWGRHPWPRVRLNDTEIGNPGDVSGIDRMITTLKRARKAMRQAAVVPVLRDEIPTVTPKPMHSATVERCHMLP